MRGKGAKSTTVVLTLDDIALLIAFVSRLDPDEYAKLSAKAMIMRCKMWADTEEETMTMRVVP